MKEASLYISNDDKTVDCFLCRHRCHISDGKRGICSVRENRGGKLHSLFYGKPVALAVDPIEKKPLFHFYPGSDSFSVATVGCNFQCPFCQNWDISQYGRDRMADSKGQMADSRFVSPIDIVENAQEACCKTIACTYSEPTIFYEYSRDIALEAEKFGIKNVYVTNGYMTREMLDDFHPHLHAANIDLKSFNPVTYRKLMNGNLDHVLDSIRYMKQKGIWIEVTTLIVTGMNDSAEELKGIADFIADVGVDIPWHISRFHPAYKETNREPTPLEALKTAYNLGKKAGLRYVYIGNIHTEWGENTFCYKCGEELIVRTGFSVTTNKLNINKCSRCGTVVDGVFC